MSDHENNDNWQEIAEDEVPAPQVAMVTRMDMPVEDERQGSAGSHRRGSAGSDRRGSAGSHRRGSPESDRRGSAGSDRRGSAPGSAGHRGGSALSDRRGSAPGSAPGSAGHRGSAPGSAGQRGSAPGSVDNRRHPAPGGRQGRGRGGRVVKDKKNPKRVARWEPVDYEPRDGSDDEFELSTCLQPVYEGEGEQVNEADTQYKNGSPDVTGDVMSCFDEPNLLYRIINKDGDKPVWAFYNDSLNYEMHVQFTFGRNSIIEPLDDTKMEQNDKGEFVCETVVYPTETEPFITGNVNGFTSKLRAVPLTDDYHNARHADADEKVEEEQDAIKQITDSDVAEEVLQACIANGVPFVDPEFPPCQESLVGDSDRPFRPLAWARPSMYLPQEMVDQVRLFRSHPQPGVVDPGELGDTWVMCSVSSVSEDPQRLLGMFRHPEGKEAAQREHAVGAYRVTFSKNGWWRSVLVDDYLPVSAGRPKFARSAKDPAEIWPCILQKAYAKLHGSYAAIGTGDPLHALNDMTGFSTLRFDEAMGRAAKGHDNEVFDHLIKGIEVGYTVIVNTSGRTPPPSGPGGAGSRGGSARSSNSPRRNDKRNDEALLKVGLLPGHAYTILDAKHFPEVDDTRIVKIRNAWGHGLEWNGDWGDNDSKWEEHPDIAEACNFQKAADGTFWMSWEDTLKYFNGGGICFSHTPAYDYRINSAFYDQVPSCVLEVEVQSPTWMTIVISQEDKRSRKDGGEYQPVMISVAKPTDSPKEYEIVLNSSAAGTRPSPDKWTFLQARDVTLINKFDAGKYLIVPRIMSGEGRPSEVPYVLGVIANQEVGAGPVSIKFKSLKGDSRVYENFPKFDDETAEMEEEVQYQKRPPGAGFPETQTGHAIE